jgi:hypothetical protein
MSIIGSGSGVERQAGSKAEPAAAMTEARQNWRRETRREMRKMFCSATFIF